VSLSWNGRIVADPVLVRIHGYKVAGGFGLRLGVEFAVPAWDAATFGDMPTVIFFPASVQVGDSEPYAIGRAFCENPKPFMVTASGSSPNAALFELVLSPAAMERLERTRNGRGMQVKMTLQAEARRTEETRVLTDEVSKTFNQSDWLAVLEQAGYGRTMLFEVPIPEDERGTEHWSRLLERARREFLLGHYSTSVGTCRLVLEALTSELKQDTATQSASDVKKRRDRTLEQRELVLRQAAMDYASPSHHTDCGHPDDLYDRRESQMVLGVTANLVASALAGDSDRRRALASSS